MNTFGPPQRVLVRGEGPYVWDVDGNRYLDLLGGIAVNALGHAHPAIVDAVTTQLTTLGHVSNFFTSTPQIELAEKLLELIGADGTGVLHQLRHRGERGRLQGDPSHRPHHHRRGGGQLPRTHHGRARAHVEGGLPRRRSSPCPATSAGSRTATPPRSRPRSTTQWPPCCSSRSRARPASSIPPDDYLPAARRIATEHGALLWLDEVQTGIGRTGEWFAHLSSGVTPDLVTVAKGLGGGIPIGACIGLGDAGTLLQPGNHGTTFGGNPVATAAALAVISDDRGRGLARARPRRRRAASAPGSPTTRWSPARPVAACSSASC